MRDVDRGEDGRREARSGGFGGRCRTPYTVMTTHSVDVGGETYVAGVITPADVIVTHPADTVRTISRC